MEKIFSFGGSQKNTSSQEWEGSKVKLKNGHLIIESELADAALLQTRQVYAVYYDNLKAILMAPDSDQTFKAAHDCVMLFVKVKNARGDRSISIQEFMVDYDIDPLDRDLTYMSSPGLTMLHVTL